MKKRSLHFSVLLSLLICLSACSSAPGLLNADVREKVLSEARDSQSPKSFSGVVSIATRGLYESAVLNGQVSSQEIEVLGTKPIGSMVFLITTKNGEVSTRMNRSLFQTLNPEDILAFIAVSLRNAKYLLDDDCREDLFGTFRAIHVCRESNKQSTRTSFTISGREEVVFVVTLNDY